MQNIDLDLAKSVAGLKNFFQKKSTVAVGVDIGTSSIKIVELEKKQNSLILKNYALIKSEKSFLSVGTQGNLNEEVGLVIKQALAKANIKTKKVNTAVPGYASLITTIELPKMSETEVESVITLEAPKYIPIPLPEVVYDWEPIKEKNVPLDPAADKKDEKAVASNATQNDKMKILLVAVMKEISKRYEDVLGKNGLKVEFLEVDSFSLKRSLVGNDQGTYVLLDIGEKVCNISVVSNGNLIVNRNIDVAGSRLTDIIAKGLNVDQQRAEQMKLKSGLELDAKLKTNLLSLALSSLQKEVLKAVEIFHKSYPETAVDGLILSGGTSRMLGLKEYLEKELKMKTIVGNPWSKIVYPAHLQPVLFNYGPLFSVAIGLAMLGLEEK